MASEIIKIIDPDSGAGFDYVSLASWESGQAADIVTADEQHTAKCRCTGGTADVTAVTLSASWTTDATRYIKIWTDPSESYRHDGTYPSGNKYRLENSSGVVSLDVGATVGHVKIFGLAITPYDTDWAMGIDCEGAAGWNYVEQCVIKGAFGAGTYGNKGIRCKTTTSVKYISNNIIYDINRATSYGILCEDASSSGMYLYNNTLHNCITGYHANSTVALFKNCIAQDCGTACYSATSSFNGSCTHNCSDDDTQPGSSGQNGEVTFENEGADDFHLGSGDTVAKDNGTDLSSDGSYPITDDIDGDTRSGSWDIGADEVAGGTTHEAVATVVGKGLLGTIAAALLLASANATVVGKGLLGDVTAHMDWSGDATVVGKGLLGDITPNVDYTSPEATVVGKGLLGTIDGDIISASAGRAVPTYLKHEGSVLFDGTSGTEVWLGFYVYASDTYNATVGRPAMVNNATTSWLGIGRNQDLYHCLGVCRENADTGNRLAVGLGGYVTQLSVQGPVAVDDMILGGGAYGTQHSYFQTIGASTYAGYGYICGIAKSTNTTGVGTVKAWLFPWKV